MIQPSHSPSRASSPPAVGRESSPDPAHVDVVPPHVGSTRPRSSEPSGLAHALSRSPSPAANSVFEPPTTTADHFAASDGEESQRVATWEPPPGLPPRLAPAQREAFVQCVAMLRQTTLTEDTLTKCARTLYPLLVKIGQGWVPDRALSACKGLQRGEIWGNHQSVLIDALDEFLARFPHVQSGEEPTGRETNVPSSGPSVASPGDGDSDVGFDDDDGAALDGGMRTASASEEDPGSASSRRTDAASGAPAAPGAPVGRLHFTPDQLDAAMLAVVRATPAQEAKPATLAKRLATYLRIPGAVGLPIVRMLMHRCTASESRLKEGSLLHKAYQVVERHAATQERPPLAWVVSEMHVDNTSGARDAAHTATCVCHGWTPQAPDVTTAPATRPGVPSGLKADAARRIREFLAQQHQALTAAEIARTLFGYPPRHPGVAAIKRWLQNEPWVGKFDIERFGRPDAIVSAVLPRNVTPGQNLAKDIIKEAWNSDNPPVLTIREILDEVRRRGLKAPTLQTVARDLLPYYVPVRPVPRNFELSEYPFIARELPREIMYSSKAALRGALHAWIREARLQDQYIPWQRAFVEFDTEVLEQSWYHRQVNKVEAALAREQPAASGPRPADALAEQAAKRRDDGAAKRSRSPSTSGDDDHPVRTSTTPRA